MSALPAREPGKLDLVPCLCKACKGKEQPRSTTRGHYAQQRRRTSRKITMTKQEALRLVKTKGKPSGAEEPRHAVASAAPQTAGHLTAIDSHTRRFQRETVPVEGPEVPRVVTAPQAGIPPVAAQVWAFVSRSLLPPHQPSAGTSSSLAIASLIARPSDAVSSSSVKVIEDNETASLQELQPGKDDPNELICDDDDWEECDEEDLVVGSVALPPGVVADDPASTAPSQSPTATNTSSQPINPALPSFPADAQPSSIPLNPDAMAGVEDVDPFAYEFHVGAAAQWSAWRITHPAVVLSMVLVAWLHLAAHLPFRICDVVLTVIGYILVEAGKPQLTPFLRTSLTGCLSALRLDPGMRMYPTCPDCLEPHPEAVASEDDASCTRCGHSLFKLDHGPTRKRGRRARARAYLRTPAKSIAEQLATLLAQPGMEDALESWRLRPRLPGWFGDFFDGAVSKSLLGPDGLLFFRRDVPMDPDGELRIGLALGIDWFSYLRSLIAPSYTSCPMSFNIVNLPPYLRYRASNLLLSMIIPGPKETDPDQTQRYVRVLVNELIRLWHKGIVLPTHRNARGRLVRVILVGVFCDKPAAHKIGGFGSHAHTFFCTRDWISQGLKSTLRAFTKGGFPARTDMHHRRMMNEYRECSSKSAREAYAKAYATRWSELGRLPYFDMCRMVVVDPMHNLFLGLVKTHFYHIWVQLKIFRKTKEIRRLHELLAEFNLPSKLGRLPKLIGEPAGGSLTADQWLILATVVGPLVLPALWDEAKGSEEEGSPLESQFFAERRATLCKTANAHKRRRQGKRATADVSRKQSGIRSKSGNPEQVRRSGRARKPSMKGKDLVLELDDSGALEDADESLWVDEDEDEDEDAARATSLLHPRDLSNFLKLCAALKLYLSDRLDDAQLDRADTLVREYCAELIELYGPEVIRPNHHYATHTADFVRDYGPLREFWTFLFERLNKILKGYRTNNHEGGEIELTFFREFHRSTQMHRTLTEGVHHPTHANFNAACRLMLNATSDNRGTLQQLAEELNDAFEDDNVSLSFSARSASERLTPALYFMFLAHLQRRNPAQLYHSEIAIPTDSSSQLVRNFATVFDYVIVGGHRYHAASRSPSAVNSLVLVRVSAAGDTWIGELQDIVLYEDSTAGLRELFGFVKWMRPLSPLLLADTAWRSCHDLFSLQVWESDVYLNTSEEPGPSPIVSLVDLLAPVARSSALIAGHPRWLTMPLSRSPIKLS